MSPSRLYTTRTITDRKVISTSGERLGEIQDVVIDTQRGCIAYAVLSYTGGFLNLRRKHFAIPWEAFIIDEAHRDLVLDIDENRLKDSPGFDDHDWPSEPDESFARDVHSYYGYGYGDRAGQETGQTRRDTQEQGMGGYQEQGTGGYSRGEGSTQEDTGSTRGSDEDVDRARRW